MNGVRSEPAVGGGQRPRRLSKKFPQQWPSSSSWGGPLGGEDVLPPCHDLPILHRYETDHYPDNKLLVARMESLWEDLRRIDQSSGVLGGLQGLRPEPCYGPWKFQTQCQVRPVQRGEPPFVLRVAGGGSRFMSA
jgi:hypothetical protein